jgi:hypothetical protein
MVFPFTIKYSKRLKEKVSSSDTEKVLSYIGDFITKKTGEDIIIDKNELTFKSGFFRMRWSSNIMGVIEKGKFNLIDNGNENVLTYEFFMYRIFAIVAVMSIVMGIVSQQPWFGVVCFAWVGGMNWLVAIIRHRNMLGDIAGGIDRLITTKSFDNQQSTAPLKSVVETHQEVPVTNKYLTILFYFTLAFWTASLIAHLSSIADFDLIEKFPFVWFLHIGIFIVIITAIFVLRKLPEMQDQQVRSNPVRVFKTLTKGTPYWLIAIAVVGLIYAGINFSLFATSQIGSPEIENGQYILQVHGQFIKTITEQEYHHYQANIVRGFSGHWLAFYGIGLALLYPFKNR